MPVDAAVAKMNSAYGTLLETYGDESSPNRHILGGVILRIADEVYKEPAVVSPSLGASARRNNSSHTGQVSKEKPKGPQPKKINEQQDDWVKLPGGGEVLGEDSQVGEGFKSPKKVKTQHEMQDNAGTSETPQDLGADSTAKDPKRFQAPKPPADGHVFSGPGWGQSFTDKDLGEDTQTGDNPETRSWDGVSSHAPSTIRSK